MQKRLEDLYLFLARKIADTESGNQQELLKHLDALRFVETQTLNLIKGLEDKYRKEL